ncbi:hypothetical protein QBC33DRAFT_598386 [Phialemonium atrogriseum]|uniref:Uncharacterized protein n=1 Tax=Phialemonium atrogriseum TaxID=1093897 RepID=A0AAJ0BS70_9PEZI|nr:uncharacterized protein QBC33DRAFT_598386 [Phialemonium atrogriseum]KAK1763505.1 hypothetical protein QBC33DRAFT_598386 [Phialemonium atrogriseum]
MFLTQLGPLAIRKGVLYNDDSLWGRHWACKCAGCVNFILKNIARVIHWRLRVLASGSITPSLEQEDVNSFRNHEIIRVALPSGVQAAIDPTGIQFGWRDYLTPWSAFARHRIHRIKEEAPCRSIHQDRVLPTGPLGVSQTAWRGPTCAARRRERESSNRSRLLGKRGMDGGYGGVSGLLRLKDSSFSKARTVLLSRVKDVINKQAGIRGS